MLKQSMDRDWEYVTHTGLQPPRDASWEPVSLPHDVSITRERCSFSHSRRRWVCLSGLVTYRRTLFVPEDWRGNSIQLEFEGVHECDGLGQPGHRLPAPLWLYQLPGGYRALAGVRQRQHDHCLGEQQRPAQLALVLGTGSTAMSGSVEGRDAYRALGFCAHPHVHDGRATVDATTELAARGRSCHTPLNGAGRSGAGTRSGGASHPAGRRWTRNAGRVAGFPSAHLWSVDAPYLYELQSEVLIDDQVVDSARTLFGVRTFSVDSERGFRLNGVPLSSRAAVCITTMACWGQPAMIAPRSARSS